MTERKGFFRDGALTRWVHDHPLATYVIIILLVVTPGFLRTEDIDNRQSGYVACVAQWADEFTHRSDELTRLAGERTEALDRMIRDLRQPASPERSDMFQQHLTEYIAASDQYIEAVTNHPVPEPPRLRCNGN